MAWWEKDFIFDVSNPFYGSIIWYGRYIDDLIIIWGSGVAAIPDFLTYLNFNQLGLNFTVDYNVDSINFLDLCLTGNIHNCTVETITFRKQVAGNTILPAKSCHPMHTIKSVPIGEMMRAKRNCTAEIKWNDEINKVRNRLTARGYEPWILNRANIYLYGYKFDSKGKPPRRKEKSVG